MLRLTSSSRRALGLAAVLVALGSGAPLAAQEPDSVAVLADSLAAADSLAVPGAEAQEPDSLAADSLEVRFFPLFPDAASRTPGAIITWELPDILSHGGLSFADLIEFTPYLDPVRVGFLEGPQAALFAGSGPAGLRYNADGYEIVPLVGGPLDLHQISLVEVERLRLVREPGGYRTVSQSYRNQRGEPYSRIEAGTGLRQTNLLRAVLSSRVGGALVGVGFDRIDTNGSPELGTFERNFVWFNLAYQLPAQVWGQLEWRNTTADRESLPIPKRRDWILRLRRAFGDAWYADVIAGTGRQEVDTLPDGIVDDSLRNPIVGEAHQLAVRAARSSESWRTQLTVRAWDGDGVPQLETEGSLELQLGPASLYGSGQFAKWESFNLAAGYGALRLQLPLGVRLLAEVEEGDRGLYGARPIPWHEFSRRTAGLELQLWSWTLMGRAGRWKVRPSPALGAPFDSATGLPGGTVDVAEGSARGPLARLFGGQLSIGGWYRWHEAGPFYYWPQTWWRLEGLYHVLALNDQLEIWLSGLGGTRGSTLVPSGQGESEVGVASERLNWFRGEVVVRIRDIHIFYNYEYFDLLAGEAGVRDFVLPQTRTHFGVKWEFWN